MSPGRQKIKRNLSDFSGLVRFARGKFFHGSRGVDFGFDGERVVRTTWSRLARLQFALSLLTGIREQAGRCYNW